MTWLTTVAGLGCDAPSTTASPMTGSWFDQTHNGEGLVIEILDDGRALVFWFSCDTSGKQAWFFGLGEQNGSAPAGYSDWRLPNACWITAVHPIPAIPQPSTPCSAQAASLTKPLIQIILPTGPAPPTSTGPTVPAQGPYISTLAAQWDI